MSELMSCGRELITGRGGYLVGDGELIRGAIGF